MSQKVLRGAAKICASKTHCPKGHELSGDNLKQYELSIGKRSCRICANKRQIERMQNPRFKAIKEKWNGNNREKLRKYSRDWIKKNPEWQREWDKNNPEKRKEINKKFAQKPERKEYHRQWERDKYETDPEFKRKKLEGNKEWRMENPRSGMSYSYEVQEAMMNVRIRDKNTCQWYGCGLKAKDGISTHVHHIFPRSEYPELETVEQYMICYCANHHGLWHRYRGDHYSEMISWREENDFYAMNHPH